MKISKMNDENITASGRLRFHLKSTLQLKQELQSPDKQIKNTAQNLLYTRYKLGETPEERREAGKALGYGDLRLRFHEYLLKTFPIT
jgi:hypothetical protein